MPFITQTLTTLVKGTFPKSIVFKVKSIFEPNVLKLVIKTIFINSIFILFYFSTHQCLNPFQFSKGMMHIW